MAGAPIANAPIAAAPRASPAGANPMPAEFRDFPRRASRDSIAPLLGSARGHIISVMLRAGLLGCWLAVSLSTFAQTPGKVDFARDIEPLLQKRCYVCHGAQQQMSGLRLDQKEAALKGGASVRTSPGKSAESRLIRLVAGPTESDAADGRAPHRRRSRHCCAPGSTRARPGVAAARSRGALVLPEDPAARRRRRCAIAPGCATRSTISSWRDWKREGIAPSPEAAKATLLRRVSLDLTGCRPRPRRSTISCSDNRPDAYERAGGPAARFAALRREVGALLARPGALRR